MYLVRRALVLKPKLYLRNINALSYDAIFIMGMYDICGKNRKSVAFKASMIYSYKQSLKMVLPDA